MKSRLLPGLILGMIFLFTNAFSQTNGGGSEKIENDKAPESHLNLLLNAANTNLNYGKSNSASLSSNKIHSWYSDFAVISNWLNTKIYMLIQMIFHFEWMDVRLK